MASVPTCPICKKEVAPRAQNSAFPFCSSRCKQVDLGKWLNEEYAVPAVDADDDYEDMVDEAKKNGGEEG